MQLSTPHRWSHMTQSRAERTVLTTSCCHQAASLRGSHVPGAIRLLLAPAFMQPLLWAVYGLLSRPLLLSKSHHNASRTRVKLKDDCSGAEQEPSLLLRQYVFLQLYLFYADLWWRFQLYFCKNWASWLMRRSQHPWLIATVGSGNQYLSRSPARQLQQPGVVAQPCVHCAKSSLIVLLRRLLDCLLAG